jgi:putative nucleotidyltransferase with HDIG domain
MNLRSSGPPRFVVRTTFATFAMVASVLSAVFILVIWNVRVQVRGTVAARLEAGQRMLSALELRRAREFQSQVATLAENPTLKAAIDTYRAELSSARATSRQELLATISRELDKLAVRITPDVLSVSDASGTVLAVAGRRRGDWPTVVDMRVHRAGSGEEFVTIGSVVYRLAGAPIVIQDAELGMLELATALDEEYARQLSALSGTSTVIASGNRLVASTLQPDATRALTSATLQSMSGVDSVELAGSTYAARLVFQAGETAVYSLDSIDASAGPAVGDAVRGVILIAVVAFGLAGFASLWMARTLARPIDSLSRSLSAMTASREFVEPVPVTGAILEVDALTQTFNTMMQTVASAEAATRSAYVGAIRALALALDARDPYTAGHAERVSAVSVAIGREMALSDDEIDVLRLGALLHDIGKIGVSDNVLRKPGALTDEEFDVIKEHPGLGAKILRSVPFLAPHLPIVELHHERPDGRGYPHGLSRDETPLLARIVHVADAFDAITSARAYRPARSSAEALTELWRHSGTQFDAEVVQALARAMPMLNSDAPAGYALDAAMLAAPRRMSVATRG